MGDTSGHIEVILGNMWGGKTTELIQKTGRYRAMGKGVRIFKPAIDDRYGLQQVTSHDRAQSEAYHLGDIGELERALSPEIGVIGIDEAQFFSDEVIDLSQRQANQGRIVIVAALYHDFRGRPFPFKDSTRTVYDLAAVADHVKVLPALCQYKGNGTTCGRDAAWVQRFVDGEVAPVGSPTIMVGAKELYEARCRQHFVRYD